MSLQRTIEPITAAEAGKILGCSARTVIRKAEARDLEYIRKLPGPNGDYLFDRLVVEQQKAGAPTADGSAPAAGAPAAVQPA